MKNQKVCGLKVCVLLHLKDFLSQIEGDLHISLFAQIAVQVNHFFPINNLIN